MQRARSTPSPGQQDAGSEGDGRHHFEINEQLETDPADPVEIARIGDAVDDMQNTIGATMIEISLRRRSEP